MKVSTKGRYGLRIMLDLAQHQDGNPVSIKTIAGRQGLSEKYMWQIIRPLTAAGLLQVKRGAKGGYRLIAHPASITLHDILLPLEGPFSIVDCIEEDTSCPRHEDCVVREVWTEVSSRLADVLRQITLQNVVDRAEARKRQPMPCSFEI